MPLNWNFPVACTRTCRFRASLQSAAYAPPGEGSRQRISDRQPVKQGILRVLKGHDAARGQRFRVAHILQPQQKRSLIW
jgi:hypothetical protein